MTEKGYISDLYKQLESVMKKCDSLSLQVKTINKTTEYKVSKKFEDKIINLQSDINTLKDENIVLKAENKVLIEKNQRLENDIDRLKKQINNNSDNSSKPPSSDTKPNIPNNRTKSGKKVGGQKGHTPHFLSKADVLEKIKTKDFEHEIIDMGNKSSEYISKFVIDVKVTVIAKEYRFYKDENGKYNIPKDFKHDVQYGSELKTICTVLNTEGIVAIDRLTDFVSSISHCKLNISNGTIVNFLNSLSAKSALILQNIKDKILNSELLYTDATTARCDNKNISVRNYSTKTDTLLIATTGKSKKDIQSSNILPIYTGNLIHDHETVMYNYGNKHGECNVHISRYLNGCFENTQNDWSISMRSFLCSLNEYKKDLISKKEPCIDKLNLDNYSLKYDEILKKGYEQNRKVNSRYYRQEEKKLLDRLNKYKENHLLFIYDFSMPFDNNLSERDLRHVKNKQKVSGYFKSMKGTQSYLDIKSIISTCKKRGLDFYKEIFNIYENIPVSL